MPNPTPPAAPQRMDRKGVLNLCLAAFMATLDSYIVNISLPTIAASFGIGAHGASAVVLAYVLSLAGTLLVFGKLSDRHPGSVLVGGYAVFTVGSLLCGISSSLLALVGARALQGVGGAMLTVSAYALIPRLAPPSETGRAFGMLATAAAVGITLGPPVGGLLTGYLGWHWIFLINVPVGIVAMAQARRSTSHMTASESGPRARFDTGGALFSFLAMAILVALLNQGHTLGWGSPTVLAAAAAVPLCLLLLALCERRAEDPLICLELMRDRRFLVANLATLATFLLLAGHNFLIPFYLQRICHYDPQTTGLILAVYSTGYLLTTGLTGRAVDRLDPLAMCLTGTLAATLACVIFAYTLGSASTAVVVVFLACLAVSYGLFIPPNSKAVMALAPAERRGAASGIFSLLSRFSLLIGVPLFEQIYSAALPSSEGAATHEAMVQGFRQAYLAGAVCCAAGAVFTWLGRRPRSPR